MSEHARDITFYRRWCDNNAFVPSQEHYSFKLRIGWHIAATGQPDRSQLSREKKSGFRYKMSRDRYQKSVIDKSLKIYELTSQ